MIRATFDKPDGTTVLVIGLSFGNLNQFRKKPRDTFIKIEAGETGLPLDVLIFSGESESAMTDFLAEFIGPDTKVHISERLKQ